MSDRDTASSSKGARDTGTGAASSGATNAGAAGLRVGIDLGTTNSLLAVVRPGGVAEVIPNKEQEMITPSVISLPRRRPDAHDRSDHCLVGRQAVNNTERAPENTIRSIKRFIGLSFADPKVQVAKQHVSYEIQAAPGGGGGVTAKISEKLLTPEEISAMILRKLKEDAEARLGSPVTQAVITVPAYFEEHRRRATRNAGALAGLTVLAILDEPTAAAISESVGETENARVLVFDFGGGTLDISLIIRAGGNLNVRSYTGDAFLGGDDIDRGIADLFRAYINANNGDLKVRNARMDVTLQTQAEAAKKTLASGQTATVYVAGICKNKDGDFMDLDLELTQEDFAGVLRSMLDRVRRLLEKFLADESLSPTHVTEVLMVGGSSAVTPFRTLLEDMFEADGTKRVKLARSPMEAVAKGAAIYASRLRALICPKCRSENSITASVCRECKEDLALAAAEIGGVGEGITQTLPRSLGVAYRQGDNPDSYQVLLKKGSRYPIQEPVTEKFYLPAASRFKIFIREGESPRASDNALIGIIDVEEIPQDVGKGDPVDVAFSYTRDRTLFIRVSYPTSKTKFEPRWKFEPPDGTSENDDDPTRALSELLPRARAFASDYDQFMEPGARKAVANNLDLAEKAVLDGNKDEAGRLRYVLHQSMLYGCGIASTLFMAENTVANEDADLGKVIREAAEKLRHEFTTNSPKREPTRRALDQAIMKALSRKIGEVPTESLGTATTLIR